MSRTARTTSILKQVLAEDAYRERPAADLLARYLGAADETAFRVLVRRYGGLVQRTCRTVLRCEAHSDEAFQQTFLSLLQVARGGRVPRSFGPWLTRTARRAALNLARRERRQARREAHAARPEPVAAGGADGADAQFAVRGAVSRLPDKYRQVLELVYFDGLTHAEAGEVLGRPKGTVDSLVKRGLDRLRGPLTQLGPPAVVLGAATDLHADAGGRAGDVLRAAAATDWTAPVRTAWLALALKSLAAATTVAVIGVAYVSEKPSRPAETATPPASAAVPFLADDNLRRLNDLLPRLVAALHGLAVGGGEVKVVEAVAFDTRVRTRFEIRHSNPILTGGRVTSVVFVLDTHSRAIWVDADSESNGQWRVVDPDKPIIIAHHVGFAVTLPLPALTGALAVLRELPADPRGPATAAARNERVREAVADFLGPWHWQGNPAKPAEFQLTNDALEFWHRGGDRPDLRYDLAHIIPPPAGRLRLFDIHGLPTGRRATLSADGRRVDLNWHEAWLTRPTGWEPPAAPRP